MGGRIWKEAELNMLREALAEGVDVPTIAQMLKRSESGVLQKMRDTGVKCTLSDCSDAYYNRRLKEMNSSSKSRYWERVEQGLCTRCGKRWAETGKRKCRVCRERDQKWYRDNNIREYLNKYNSVVDDERRKNNQCLNCGKPLKESEIGINVNCAACRKKNMERTNLRRLRDRIRGIPRKR